MNVEFTVVYILHYIDETYTMANKGTAIRLKNVALDNLIKGRGIFSFYSFLLSKHPMKYLSFDLFMVPRIDCLVGPWNRYFLKGNNHDPEDSVRKRNDCLKKLSTVQKEIADSERNNFNDSLEKEEDVMNHDRYFTIINIF